ncbi:MAG TPA: DUF4440 domain-containing protein [Candidatus Eisenbacteria bacterium]
MAAPGIRDRAARARRSGAIRRPATRAGITALVALLIAGCAGRPAAPDPAALRASVDAANKQFMDAFARKDAPAIGLLYAEDARAYPPGAPLVDGRPAIEKMWGSVVALPVSEVRIETAEVNGGADWAWETGRYTIVGSDSQNVETGKYLVVWKHDEAGWKLYRDVWNSDAPATSSSPEETPAPAGK